MHESQKMAADRGGFPDAELGLRTGRNQTGGVGYCGAGGAYPENDGAAVPMLAKQKFMTGRRRPNMSTACAAPGALRKSQKPQANELVSAAPRQQDQANAPTRGGKRPGHRAVERAEPADGGSSAVCHDRFILAGGDAKVIQRRRSTTQLAVVPGKMTRRPPDRQARLPAGLGASHEPPGS